jgi:hypothetical protein
VVEFFYSTCGHLVGCDDPTFDLEAEQARRRQIVFDADLKTAIETGEYRYRSSCPLSHDARDAIAAVADEYPNPTEEAIETARRVFCGEPHSEPVVVASGVNFDGGRLSEPNAVIYRIAYWDGTPGLVVGSQRPNRMSFEMTIKLGRYDNDQPRPGNVAVRSSGIYDGVHDGLHTLGIVGDVIKSGHRFRECKLLV